MVAVERLAEVLPPGKYDMLAVSTPARRCRKLVFTKTSDKSADTRQYHRFVFRTQGIAFLAVEFVTYVSKDSFTLFVCKVDTSGYFPSERPNIALVMRVLIEETLRISPKQRVRVCLFAKSLGEYLFLGSKSNKRKHVLSGAELVKWWLRCLDQIESVSNVKARLRIPGLDDENSVAKYFPLNAKWDWRMGDIFEAKLAVNAIPRFPDDPKHRLLDAIVDTGRAKQVSPTLFFAELEAQQEFRLQKSVAIIGLEGDLQKLESLDEPIISAEKFVELEAEMNELDFSSEELALKSTTLLFDNWALNCVSFEGKRLNLHAKTSTENKTPRSEPAVHDITSIVRKKRKTA